MARRTWDNAFSLTKASALTRAPSGRVISIEPALPSVGGGSGAGVRSGGASNAGPRDVLPWTVRPERIEHPRPRPPQQPPPCAPNANYIAGSPTRRAAARPGELCHLRHRSRSAAPPSPPRSKYAAGPTAPSCLLLPKQPPFGVHREAPEISRIVRRGLRRYTAQTGRLRSAAEDGGT